jgi:hypothetical protein
MNRGKSSDDVSNNAIVRALTQRVWQRAVVFLELLSDVLNITFRAYSAAHYYETLRVSSDQRLAEMGLKRSELPRSAFLALTKGQ